MPSRTSAWQRGNKGLPRVWSGCTPGSRNNDAASPKARRSRGPLTTASSGGGHSCVTSTPGGTHRQQPRRAADPPGRARALQLVVRWLTVRRSTRGCLHEPDPIGQAQRGRSLRLSERRTHAPADPQSVRHRRTAPAPASLNANRHLTGKTGSPDAYGAASSKRFGSFPDPAPIASPGRRRLASD